MSRRLEDMTPDQLRQYANELELKNKMKTIPQELDEIGFEPIVDMCKDHLIRIAEHGEDDTDFQQWLYEATMEAIYGPKIFNWINNELN